MSSIVSLHGCRWPRRKTIGVVTTPSLPGTPVVPLMVTEGTPVNTTDVYVVGAGATPFEAITRTALNNSDIGDPRLSPDETKIVYSYTSGLSPASAQIRVGALDHLSDSSIRSGISVFTHALTLSPAWSPDGNEIAFVLPPATFGGNWSVAKMNSDGSGYTVLYTISTGLSGLTVRGLSWAPSGDYIAVRGSRLSNGPDTIHVVNTDGSGGSAIFTGPSGTGLGGALSAPAWKHGSDVLGFCVGPGSPASTDILWRTCNADGTSLTTIYTDTARVYGGCERFSWLSDDSALVALKTISGPNSELALIDGAGGGPTDSGIVCGPAGFMKLPFVMDTAGEAPRIYYTTADASNVRTLSSVREDFTDQRVDWDGADYTTVQTQHHGIFEYDVN